MQKWIRLILIAAISLSTITRIGYSQQLDSAHRGTSPATDSIEHEVRIGIVVAGGVSLGSYQGGMTWALTSLLRALRDSAAMRTSYDLRVRPNVVALGGASAGNINSLLSLNSWCRSKAHLNWRQSLNWAVWGEVGVDQLLPERSQYLTGDGLFSRRFMVDSIKPLIDDALGEAVNESCDVHIATTMTALNRRILSRGNLTVQTQRVVSIVHAFHGDSSRLRLTYPAEDIRQDPKFISQVYLTERRRRPRFDLSGRFDVPRDMMFVQSLASSAIPGVFGPIALHYFPSLSDEKGSTTCLPDPQQTGFCAEESSDLFVDGGVFDNTPIALTRHLLERTIPRDSASWPTPILIYVDTDRERGPAVETRNVISAGRAMGFGGVTALLSSAIPTARQYELQGAIRREAEGGADVVSALPDGRQIRLAGGKVSSSVAQLAVTSRRYPLYGGEVGAFGAFIDKRLREYDFLQGIYDGAYVLAREVLCRDTTSTRDACTIKFHRRILTEKALGLTVSDSAFLSCLLEFDYAAVRPYSLCQNARNVALPGDAALRVRRMQFLALQLSRTEEFCRKVKSLSRVLCSSHLYAALDTLGANAEYRVELDFKPGADDWTTIEDLRKKGLTGKRAYLQQDQFWDELANRIADRAFIVEAGKSEADGGHKGWARLAGYAVHALTIPYKRDAHRWFETRSQSEWSKLTPDYLTFTPQSSALGVGYRLLKDIRPGHSFPIGDMRVMRVRIPNDRVKVLASAHTGYNYQRPSFLFSGFFVGPGVSGCFCKSADYRAFAPTVRVSVSTLFQRVSIGLEQPVGRYPQRFVGFNAARRAFSFQINDIPGLLYWNFRR